MYHDQNKHTRLSSLPTYSVNTGMCLFCQGGSFIAVRASIFFISLCCQDVIASRLSPEQTSTPICCTDPLAWVVGDIFSTKGFRTASLLPKPNSSQCVQFQSLVQILSQRRKSAWISSRVRSRTWVKRNCSASASWELEWHWLAWQTMLITKK